MKLMLPDLMRHLTEKTVALLPPDGSRVLIKPRQKLHGKMILPMLPIIHKAEKFIFDSGLDESLETADAVRATAAAMMGYGIFHLPAPLVWIEDPYSDEARIDSRRYYICYENQTEIRMYMLQTFGPNMVLTPGAPRCLMFTNCVSLDTTGSSGAYSFRINDTEHCRPEVEKIVQEAVFAVVKFIVTLGTQQTIRERVDVPKVKSGKAGRRGYSHTIIRVPSYTHQPEPGEAGGTPRKRRMSLVAGYVWGKNTRPASEQRWIPPHWRGDASLGLVPPKVRVVEQRPKG